MTWGEFVREQASLEALHELDMLVQDLQHKKEVRKMYLKFFAMIAGFASFVTLCIYFEL